MSQQLAPPDGLPSDILRVSLPFVNVYVLRDAQSLYLLDSGLVGTVPLLRRALRAVDWDHLPIRGIILTHGHLDHTGGAAALQQKYGAWVAAPTPDQELLGGDYRCPGWGRVGAWLQRAGAALLRYRPPSDVRWYQPGDRFDIFGGLQSVPLPGHTPGHCGWLAERHNLLFSGDVFASWSLGMHLPPSIFNHEDAATHAAARTVLDLRPSGLAPGHGTADSPATHLRRLQRLCAAHG